MGLFELLVYGFMFGAFLLFNYVTQQAAKRRREQQRREQEAFGGQSGTMEEATVPTADPLGQAWGRTPETLPNEALPYEAAPYKAAPYEVAPGFREEAPVRAASAPRLVYAAPARVGQLRTRSRFLRTRQDLRNAVVAMTVLGPCRALQPYDMTGASSAGNVQQPPLR